MRRSGLRIISYLRHQLFPPLPFESRSRRLCNESWDILDGEGSIGRILHGAGNEGRTAFEEAMETDRLGAPLRHI